MGVENQDHVEPRPRPGVHGDGRTLRLGLVVLGKQLVVVALHQTGVEGVGVEGAADPRVGQDVLEVHLAVGLVLGGGPQAGADHLQVAGVAEELLQTLGAPSLQELHPFQVVLDVPESLVQVGFVDGTVAQDLCQEIITAGSLQYIFSIYAYCA